MRSNCASSLSVFVSVAVYMMVADGSAYADNGDSFNGVFKADGLVFGVLGHYGPVDYWECMKKLLLLWSNEAVEVFKIVSEW